MQIEIKKEYRFKGGKCSIIHNGQYIFSANEAKELGLKSELEEYFIYRLQYDKDENLRKAIEMMPDYECWDSHRKVLLKSTKPCNVD